MMDKVISITFHWFCLKLTFLIRSSTSQPSNYPVVLIWLGGPGTIPYLIQLENVQGESTGNESTTWWLEIRHTDSVSEAVFNVLLEGLTWAYSLNIIIFCFLYHITIFRLLYNLAATFHSLKKQLFLYLLDQFSA